MTSSEKTNAPATTTRMSAAAVMRRPVVAVPMRMDSAVDMSGHRTSTTATGTQFRQEISHVPPRTNSASS